MKGKVKGSPREEARNLVKARVVEYLRKVGTYNEVDDFAVEALVNQILLYRKLIDAALSSEVIVPSERGTKVSPVLGQAYKALAGLYRLLSDFGLTPKSRKQLGLMVGVTDVDSLLE